MKKSLNPCSGSRYDFSGVDHEGRQILRLNTRVLMKQTIFVYHSVTDKMAKKPCLGLISCKAYHYITQIIKLILYFSVASKFVKTKYKEIFYCLIQKNCQLRSLSPQYLNMGKLQFLHQHVKNQLGNLNSLKRSHFCTD